MENPSSRGNPVEPVTCSHLGKRPMTVEAAIRILAGSFVVLSLVLSQLVSPWFLLLAAFVGANLVQSAFTGLCPAESVLRRLGVGRT